MFTRRNESTFIKNIPHTINLKIIVCMLPSVHKILKLQKIKIHIPYINYLKKKKSISVGIREIKMYRKIYY